MQSDSSQQLKITVVAIGAKASSQLAYMGWMSERGVRRVAIAPNNYIPPAASVDHVIHLPFDRRVADATAKKIGDVAESIVSAKMPEIEALLVESDLIIFRGNITSSLIAHEIKIIATKMRARGKLVLYAYALPFSFEGALPQSAAKTSENIVSGSVDAMIPIDSDSLVIPGMSAAQALSAVGDYVEEFTGACISMIQTCGTINIDWNDIRSTVINAKNVHVKSVVGSVDRPDELVEKIFSAAPGVASSGENFQRAVYVISSGADVSAQAVHELGKNIESHLASDARIIFGLEEKELLADEIGLTIVAGAN